MAHHRPNASFHLSGIAFLGFVTSSKEILTFKSSAPTLSHGSLRYWRGIEMKAFRRFGLTLAIVLMAFLAIACGDDEQEKTRSQPRMR
jgi:hypothetical protein